MAMEDHVYKIIELASSSTESVEDAIRKGVGRAAETLERSYPPEVRDPIVFGEYRSRFLCNDPVGYGFANMAFAGNEVDALVGGVAHPSLLLAGVHDGLRPPESVRALAARMQNAAFDVVDAGHVMPLQAPRHVAAHLSTFLTP